MKHLATLSATSITLALLSSALFARMVPIYTKFNSTAPGFTTCSKNDPDYNNALHYNTAGNNWGWGRYIINQDICTPLTVGGEDYVPPVSKKYQQQLREFFGYSYAHYVPGVQLVKYKDSTGEHICVLKPSDDTFYITVLTDPPYKNNTCYVLTRIVDSSTGLSGDPSLDPNNEDKWICAYPNKYSGTKLHRMNSTHYKVIKSTPNATCPLAKDKNTPAAGYNDYQLPYKDYCECSFS